MSYLYNSLNVNDRYSAANVSNRYSAADVDDRYSTANVDDRYSAANVDDQYNEYNCVNVDSLDDGYDNGDYNIRKYVKDKRDDKSNKDTMDDKINIPMPIFQLTNSGFIINAPLKVTDVPLYSITLDGIRLNSIARDGVTNKNNKLMDKKDS